MKLKFFISLCSFMTMFNEKEEDHGGREDEGEKSENKKDFIFISI